MFASRAPCLRAYSEGGRGPPVSQPGRTPGLGLEKAGPRCEGRAASPAHGGGGTRPPPRRLTRTERLPRMRFPGAVRFTIAKEHKPYSLERAKLEWARAGSRGAQGWL